MWRAIAWLALLGCAAFAHFYSSDSARIICVLGVLVVLTIGAPRDLLIPLSIATAGALLATAAGQLNKLLDIVPALIAALIGWIFARTLIANRRPLIARAIAALDGAEQLDDPAVARYARRLTAVWALYQGVLAAVAAAFAVYVWLSPRPLPNVPSPRAFGAVLPVAVAALFVAEFRLRRFLLPQAPRRGLLDFARGLIAAWPQLIKD